MPSPCQMRLRFSTHDKEPKVWRYAHYSSYTPWASKRSVMISTLKKVNKMASNEENLVMSAYCKLKEFAKLRYPIPALLRACSVVYSGDDT